MKEGIIAGIVFLLFFAMMFAATIYDATMKEECRVTAMKQTYTAVEVQAICK